MGKKRLFISDVHLGAGKLGDKGSKYEYEWDWLSHKETADFMAFLEYLGKDYLENIKEVVLLGDIFDNWICPHDIVPPTIEEIIQAPKNQGVIAALKKLSKKISVFYVPGNHDMHASKDVINKHFPEIVYCPKRYIAGRLVAEHGHQYALFNSPASFSPNFYGLPLGYFISRMEATRKGTTGKQSRDYKSYIDDALELFGGPTLPQCVFEAVLEESGLTNHTEFVFGNDKAAVTAAQIKEQYKNLYEDWPGKIISRSRAVLAELDRLEPIADRLCSQQGYKVCIFGHSHKSKLDKDSLFVDDRIYANSGYWCGDRCTFVEVEKLNSQYKVQLKRWKNKRVSNDTPVTSVI